MGNRPGLITRAVVIYKNDGFVVLLRSILIRLRMEYILLPFAMMIVRFKKTRNIDDLIDFCFSLTGGLIRPLQIRSEIKTLMEIIGERRPEIILEIGTFNGGTLFLFSRVVSKAATMISVDFPDVRFGGGYDWWKNSLFKAFRLRGQSLTLIRADSHKAETLNEVIKVLRGRKIDFLFIDGDHSYQGVKQDFEMYCPLVGINALIAFHDIVVHPPETGCEVSIFWKGLNPEGFIKKEIIDDDKQVQCGIGILERNGLMADNE